MIKGRDKLAAGHGPVSLETRGVTIEFIGACAGIKRLPRPP